MNDLWLKYVCPIEGTIYLSLVRLMCNFGSSHYGNNVLERVETDMVMVQQSMEEVSAEVVSDEEAFLFAMELVIASAVPMVLKSALDLGILEIIAKAGPGAYLSPSQIAAQIPIIKNPNASALLDRMLRLLASYKILTHSLIQSSDGKAENHYGLHPKGKYFVTNEDGVSVAALFLMLHDKVLKEMWYCINRYVYFFTLFKFYITPSKDCGQHE